jgi:hypothetical protein
MLTDLVIIPGHNSIWNVLYNWSPGHNSFWFILVYDQETGHNSFWDVHDPWMRLFGAPRGWRVEITTPEPLHTAPRRELEETPRQLRDAPPIKGHPVN